ncbi:MAG TPA: CDGSH iron-sulfur domain-containing protein [Planctomycetota bacterium]|nr:CDGSH iron-sulfur domain-containing protein [Planctomycetota bacterium]
MKVVFDAPRTVVWCACGESQNKPYCDGSHSRV